MDFSCRVQDAGLRDTGSGETSDVSCLSEKEEEEGEKEGHGRRERVKERLEQVRPMCPLRHVLHVRPCGQPGRRVAECAT